MKLSERLPGNIKFLRGVCAVRSLSPATQRTLVEPRPRKHPGYCFGVNRFSLVRRAHDRKLALIDAEMIRRAACDERDRLNRFDSRARRGDEAVVAKLLEDAPVRFGDYDCAAVPRFDYRASPDLDQYWQLVLHCEKMPEEKLTLAQDIAHDNLAARVN
jgi:hypothetical protein